jgi:hypothetical protein
MSLSGAMIQALKDEGLDVDAIIRVALATDRQTGVSNAERQKRYRDKKKAERNSVTNNGVTVTRNAPPGSSPKDNTQTPSLPPAEVSEPVGSSPQPRPWALPVGVSLQVWSDFLGNRKRKRLGNTDTAWKGFCDDLNRVASQTGIPPPRLIEHAAKKGWGSINAPDEDQVHGRTNRMAGHQSTDGLSATGRALAAFVGRSPNPG